VLYVIKTVDNAGGNAIEIWNERMANPRHSIGGGMFGALGGAATGSVVSFATTYALGQVAKQYYAGGRTISVDQLKQAFSSLLDQGRNLHARYSGEIRQKACTIDVNQIAGLVRQQ
jgi:hypothetical protein